MNLGTLSIVLNYLTKRNLLFLCFLLTTLWVDGQNYVWTKVNQNGNYALNTGGGYWATGYALTDGEVTYQVIDFEDLQTLSGVLDLAAIRCFAAIHRGS